MTARILVADDTPWNRDQLAEYLARMGHEVETAPDGISALRALRERDFRLLLTDWRMPGLDGLELTQAVREERIPVGIVMLTGFADTDVAVRAMKLGADDFLCKPFEPERLSQMIKRILERRALLDEKEALRRMAEREYGYGAIVSRSPRMRLVFDLIDKVAPVGSTVLIGGETGTGKELVARAIHACDSGRTGPLVTVNCAALSDALLESELFGHEKGAFTGADAQRKGRFERADGGTLFLDEVGDVSPAMQAKLLRALQSGEFERVGGSETIRVDVRLIAATHVDLEARVRAGKFRSDLYYRLNVVRIDLPPLRDRPEDVPLLVAHFLDRFAATSIPPVTEIHADAMQALMDHTWPGNVRELENAIRAAVAMADGSILRREHLPATVVPRRAEDPFDPRVDVTKPLPEVTESLVCAVEREYFAQLLGLYRGNVARCARHSGLSRRSVTQKLRKYALDRRSFKVGAGGAEAGDDEADAEE